MMLSISESAKRVGASRATLYKMKKSGEISFSVTADGTNGIEESELARAFPLRYKVSSDTMSRIHSNTAKTHQKELSADNTAHLVEKIEFLQNELIKAKERELSEMTRRAHDAESRLDEMIKMAQEQSKQLLIEHQSPSKSLWQKLANLTRSK